MTQFRPNCATKRNKTRRRNSIKSLPRNSNIISFHHFFKVKHDVDEQNIKLKCRLVSHGNRNVEKESNRWDSSTSQFLCIRVLFSLETLFQFFISTVDISAACLKSGELQLHLYMRPTNSWMMYIDKVWELLKLAYSVVNSGRFWQLHIE